MNKERIVCAMFFSVLLFGSSLLAVILLGEEQVALAQGSSLEDRFRQSSDLFSQQTFQDSNNTIVEDITEPATPSAPAPAPAPLPTSPTTSDSPSLADTQRTSRDQRIVQQGTLTSSTDPLPGHEEHQSATILRLRNDNAVYSGILTFTASNEVEVQVFHRISSSSPSSIGIPESFGTLATTPLPDGSGTIVISSIVPDYDSSGPFTASIPFTGNSLSLHNVDGVPFAASYTVTADVVGPPETINDIVTEPAATPSAESDEQEEGENNN